MKMKEIDLAWCPTVISLSQVQGAFSTADGFPRPDWKIIREAVKQKISSEGLANAWDDIAAQWMLQLRASLGDQYRVWCSREFLLVSALDAAASEQVLSFAETTLNRVNDLLKDAAWKNGLGKHVILLFLDDHDYYQYISFFYPEGNHPASSGCLIPWNYVHIAMLCGDGGTIRSTLAHELTHNALVHLPLPLWLNEGLAVLIQKAASENQYPPFDTDLRDRHFAFWNPGSIQKFWSGVSFYEPGESDELSYSLAEILIRLLLESGERFGAFLKNARWNDAGQSAALSYLHDDLGRVLGIFLGEGDWTPNPKAMEECWNAVHGRSDQRQSGHADAG